MVGSMIYKSYGLHSRSVESMHSFSGVLDGDGHSISYSYKETTYAGAAGLFVSLDSAEIKI